MINLSLSIISGILIGLSFDLSRLSFLIWFALVPFLYVAGQSKLKEGVLNSFIFSLFYYGLAIFWISNVTKLGFFVLLPYLSFYCICFFLLTRFLLKKSLRIITIASLWVILEFLRENVWCGFGWANLGYSQYKNLYFIQVADLLGVKVVSFIIIMVNVLIYELIFIRKFILKKTVSVSLIIILCFFYSFYRLRNLKETDSVEISLVQPNISQEVKQDIYLRPYIIKKLKTLAKEIEGSSLIIYPEAAWPQINNNNEFDELQEFTRDLNKEVLMGAVIIEGDKFYNTALLLGRDGRCTDIYRKIKLVPFGEYVPLRELLVAVEALNSIENMERGKAYKVFSYKDKKFSVLICFEDIFPSFVSRFSKKSDFLINITDDSWFKGEPQASQHLAIMTLRAIENRISVVRCANTGISAWVSFKGQINKLKKDGREVFIEDVLSFKLPLNAKKSLYNKVGEVLPILCSLILLTVFFHR